MKTKQNVLVHFLFPPVLFVVLLVSSCVPSQFLAPTMTPTLTFTASATVTPTQTSTPTATFTPTITLTPTLTAGQILDQAVASACQGGFTISYEGDSSSDQLQRARLCPGVDKIILPEEWVANSLDSLRYIVNIETGTSPVRNCDYEGGLRVQVMQSFQKIIVYDSMTGAVVKEKTVSGPRQVYCPTVYHVGGSNNLTGDYASPIDVEDGMIASLRSLLPALKVEPASLISHADLTGTVWNEKDSFGDQYTLEFLAGGILNISYSNGTYYTSGIWEQNGNSVSFSINNKFVIYEVVIRRNIMKGSAKNKNGFSWTWTAELQQ